MFTRLLRIGAVTALCVAVVPFAASAQATPGAPAPDATSTPHQEKHKHHAKKADGLSYGPLHFSGQVRGYAFDRLNAIQNGSNPNRTATNFSGALHVEYKPGNGPFSVGVTYTGADPFGLNGPNPRSNNRAFGPKQTPINTIDNTLPGFQLSTFNEAYLRYATAGFNVTVGDQVINKPWAPNSDSRLKPVSFQGIDATANVSKVLSVGLTRMIRFENRNESLYDQGTLLTSPVAGANPVTTATTDGFLRVAATYTPSNRFVGTAENYAFLNIANLTYVEGRYNIAPSLHSNPFIAAQFVGEAQAGKAVVGKIDNQTTGVQLGTTVLKNLVFTVGSDYAPYNYALVHAASASAAAAGFYGGAASAVGGGAFRVAYGGIASPYTDSFSTDPLYTSSISQGVVDRRVAGTSYKAGFAFTNSTKQLKVLVSEAFYNQNNGLPNNGFSTAFAFPLTGLVSVPTDNYAEFNTDVTYYFNKVRSGSYKGFMYRERYADRSQPGLPYSFKYIRTQFEYDF